MNVKTNIYNIPEFYKTLWEVQIFCTLNNVSGVCHISQLLVRS